MIRLGWLAVVGACTPPPGTALETWNGVTAYVYAGKRVPVYARSAADASYVAPGVTTSTIGFQCTELAIRYFRFQHGVAEPWGSADADDMCEHHPSVVSVVATPAVGDLVVFAANATFDDNEIGSSGHVAVIRGIGDGQLDLFQQRWGDETTALLDGIEPEHAKCFLRAP